LTTTGADNFVATARQLGISDVFTLVGDHLNAVLAAAGAAGIRVIDMRHESAAVHAADAWARLHRRPSVALVTGGPGHTNAITGIATAHLAGSPVILISGSRAHSAADRQGFQDIDQVNTVRPVVKWAAEVPAASQIPFYLRRAWMEAQCGRKGAVHLTIPVDVFHERGAAADVPPVGEPAPAVPDVGELVAALRMAERPVAIAGSGIWWAGAGEELRSFIERTGIPLWTLSMARGTVSDEHPLCMGIGHPALNRAARDAFLAADVVLVLGKRIDFRLAFGSPRLFSPDASFLQVDIHPQELGLNRRLQIGLVADVKAALRAVLLEAGTEWPRRRWLDRVREMYDAWQSRIAQIASDHSDPLHPAAMFTALRDVLPRDVLYAWDGGDFTHWGRTILPAREPGAWLRLGPLATIGAALPFGLAMQIAHPRKPVAVITGDGALGFYISEMDTAVRHKLPVVIIVGNDAGWGLERELQSATEGQTVACELRQTRYDIVMQGFGGGGETVASLGELLPAVERAFSAGIPYVINARIRGARSPFTEWQLEGKKQL
jgi:acetolactate synthase-1/2/3 large subunit